MKRPPGESWTQQLTSLAGQAAAIGMVRRHGRRASLSWPLASLRGLQWVSLLQASTAEWKASLDRLSLRHVADLNGWL
jgi:hypothetical protein